MEKAPTDRTTAGVLAGLSLSMLLSSLGTSIANVSLPELAGAFHAALPSVQWVVLAYLLAITALIVSAGRLGDLIGRRRLLLAGLALYTLASLLCALAPSLGALIAGRAVQGLGASVMMALTVALVGEAVPRERAGRAMGLLGAMSAAGTALGPAAGGLLIGVLGWRAIFAPLTLLGLAAVALVWRFMPADRARDGKPVMFDSLGTVVLALTLAAYALAMTLGGGVFGVLNIALLGAAVLGIVVFVVIEGHAASPLVPFEAVRDPRRATGFVLAALVTTVAMTTLVVGPFYLALGLGLTPAPIGLVLSIGPVAVVLTGVPMGRLVDRFGTRRVTLLGLVALACGSALLAVIPVRFGVSGFAVPYVLLTLGYAGFQTANNTAIMAGVDGGERGVVSGLLNLARNLGLITCASVMGALFVFASGTTAIAKAQPDAVATGLHVTFAVSAVLTLTGLALFLKTKPPGMARR